MKRPPTTFRIIGQRPADVPDGWAIHNAPCPLYGDRAWEGDFVHGIHYAAIAPHTPTTALFEQENALNGAVTLEYVSEDEAISEQIDYYDGLMPEVAAKARAGRDDPDTRAKILDGWRNRQRVIFQRSTRSARQTA